LSQNLRNIALWLVIILLLFFIVNKFSATQVTQAEINYSELINYIRTDVIKKVEMHGKNVKGEFLDPKDNAR